jgi:hypothetical protein
VSLYAGLAAALIWCGCIGGAFWYGLGLGEDRANAQAAREDRIAVIATEAAASAAAGAIARIEVKNTTIHQTLERVTRENTIFTDCRSGPVALGLLNSTAGIAGPDKPAAGGELPPAGAAR